MEVAFGGGTIGELRRRQSDEVARHVGSPSVRILVDDGLELLARFRGAFLSGSEAGVPGLGRHSSGTNWLFEDSSGAAQFETRFFVLRIEVVPTAKSYQRHDGHNDARQDEFGLVLNRPVNSLFGRMQGGFAKAIFFQLMAGF